ncbi:MAG: hypothetical protein RLZZ416_424 [Candidatus Parcubacteria bacterium]|jgi:hypothetical protein
MLTNKDIDKLMHLFPTKEGVRKIVREELVEIKKSIHDLMLGFDKLASTVDKLLLGYAAISGQISRHERWIKQIAQKAGIALKA